MLHFQKIKRLCPKIWLVAILQRLDFSKECGDENTGDEKSGDESEKMKYPGMKCHAAPVKWYCSGS